MLYLFWGETKTEDYIVIFQARRMLTHTIQKVSARAYHWCGWAINVVLFLLFGVWAKAVFDIHKNFAFTCWCVFTSSKKKKKILAFFTNIWTEVMNASNHKQKI